MAPEILLGLPYQGHVVDLFAVGVFIFTLYAGSNPFYVAKAQDPYFNLLLNPEKTAHFWK
jgi:hypothetical protein